MGQPEPARSIFVSWLSSLQIDYSNLWLLRGDFNLYRSTENRNRPGGNQNDILLFNNVISQLGLVELPLKGRSFTWSNMQSMPLLQQLDWFFTIPTWTVHFPNTVVLPRARIISDHKGVLSAESSRSAPCKIQIGTAIPKACIFRFENFWPLLPGFHKLVKDSWEQEVSMHITSNAQKVSVKLKRLRSKLKAWDKNKSNLARLIQNCNIVIVFLDDLEDMRGLYLPEQNFRRIIQGHLQDLLKYQQIYWKQRFTTKMMKLGDDNTKFFHAMATENYRRNSIAQVVDVDGRVVTDHEGKAFLFLQEFKSRMGSTVNPIMLYNLQELIGS